MIRDEQVRARVADVTRDRKISLIDGEHLVSAGPRGRVDLDACEASSVQPEHRQLSRVERKRLQRNTTRQLTFACYRAMIRRCYDPRLECYPRYGGRGITVCERWRNSRAAFIEDMGMRPSKAYSLDRYPNPAGNYEPGNVRWATSAQQYANKVPKPKRPPKPRDWSKKLIARQSEPRTAKRPYACKRCGGTGHQARTCERLAKIRGAA